MQRLRLGAHLFDDVRTGKKQATIREGHRILQLGPTLLHCEVDSIEVDVWRTSYVRLRHLDFAAIGYPESVDEVLARLRKYYPTLDRDSPVTVIEF